MGEIRKFPTGEKIEATDLIINREKYLKFQAYISQIINSIPSEYKQKLEEMLKDPFYKFPNNEELIAYINNHDESHWSQNPTLSYGIYAAVEQRGITPT